jgi:hypothetical protein
VITLRSPAQHSVDNCRKCRCRKWHQSISTDSITKEKIVILSKEKGTGCTRNLANCKTITVDGRCNYKYITSQYFSNGQLHKKQISKGWSSGWGGKSKTTAILYDESGKEISRTTKKVE